MEIIDLSKNENPLGCSPLATHMASVALQHMHQYPCHEAFTHTIAEKHATTTEQVFVASGASEIMDLLARTRLSADDTAVTTKGSFAAYTTITHNAGATIQTPAAPEHQCSLDDVSSVIDATTKIVWLSHPNNPAGAPLQTSRVTQLALEHPHVTIVCDEAYIDYMEDAEAKSMLAARPLPDNIVVLRSFSKLHGIAGARIGYAIAVPETVTKLKKLQLPFSVSSVAIAAATGALIDEPFQDLSRSTNIAARTIIETTLATQGSIFLPSVCNFVSFAHPQALHLQQQLLQHGFAVRELTQFGMPGFLRVSTGTVLQTQLFTCILQELLAQKRSTHEPKQ